MDADRWVDEWMEEWMDGQKGDGKVEEWNRKNGMIDGGTR